GVLSRAPGRAPPASLGRTRRNLRPYNLHLALGSAWHWCSFVRSQSWVCSRSSMIPCSSRQMHFGTWLPVNSSHPHSILSPFASLLADTVPCVPHIAFDTTTSRETARSLWIGVTAHAVRAMVSVISVSRRIRIGDLLPTQRERRNSI